MIECHKGVIRNAVGWDSALARHSRTTFLRAVAFLFVELTDELYDVFSNERRENDRRHDEKLLGVMCCDSSGDRRGL